MVKKNFTDIKLAIQLSKPVREICTALFNQTCINSFSYSRVFPDGSRSELWSDLLAMEHTFLKKRYICNFYTPDLYDVSEKFLFLPEKVKVFSKNVSINYLQQLADQRMMFNHDNAFIAINRHNFLVEYFIFYTSQNCKSPLNFYLNHIVQLTSFIQEFKQQSASLILEADKNKLIKPWRIVDKCKINKIQGYNDSKIKPYITPRELQIIDCTIKGNTAKETAEKLGISFRTVETYMENMKLRFNCKRKSELVAKLITYYRFI
ncbi:MAG: hypothetical protein QG673_1888 [Pseudomonadota bacterium]|nr:hypothetical protein [Pseudomonadota bacterium]